jgi:ribonuclease-3
MALGHSLWAHFFGIAREVKAEFLAVLGYQFKEPSLLRLALTHASVADRGLDNERLEFLGDRVLGLVVADLLLKRFPEEKEGALAKRHAALVRREALARVAEEIGLGDELILAKSEEGGGGRSNPTLLADACEALIGALYRDGGLDLAETFIERHWKELIGEAVSPPIDAKSALQEWAQARSLPLPSYKVLHSEGLSHKMVFTIEVSLPGISPAVAKGSSKRAAEQAAARQLLDIIGHE